MPDLTPEVPDSAPASPCGGGEMARRIRAHDWAATPLGPVEGWPPSLRTAVNLMLASPGPVSVLWGPEGVQLYNDAYVPIAAERHPQALGRPARQVWAEAYEPFLGPILDRVFRGEAVTVEDRAVVLSRPDGAGAEERHFAGSFTPIRDEAGAVGGIWHPLTETTARVRADAARRASEARLKALAAASSDVLYRMSPDWGEMRELAGGGFLPDTKDPSRAWLMDYIPPEDQAMVTAAIERAIAARAVFELEHRVRRIDGTTGWTLSRAVPILGPDGTIREWFGAATDVTARREAEAELRRANEVLEARVAERTAERNLLATIVETTDVMVMACALDYTILAINKANVDEFERIYGTRPKAGDNILALLADRLEEQAQVRAGWGRALAGEELTFVEDFGDPTHDRPYYEIKFRTLRDATGMRVGAYQFVTDVTERLRRDAQLAEAQEQLRQAQKMDAMGQLTGGVAHDFNNLLTPIIGSLDRLLSRGVGSERERRLMAGALESAERAKTLVQRLLAFARRQPLQPVAVDVGALVEGMAGLLGSTLGPTIDVRVELAPDLPPAKADPNQLEMALLNLAVNARDAMPRGGTLTIKATRESTRRAQQPGLRQGHYVRLVVTDTGIGMDEATRERAVEPFFSTKGVGRGTGLGLSMVHGLAAQLGGGLVIDSEPGRGTTVELWLPVSAELADRAGDGPAAAWPATSRGQALLVDDEELVRMSTADMLMDLGLAVLEVGSAEHALRLLREGTAVDLLVTDHLMPGMSGVELAREVKVLRPGLPILIVSGYANVDGLAPDLPRLVKPFRVAELAERVAAVMPSSAHP